MKFCNLCNNMYYIGIHPDDASQLTYYCRHCGNVDEMITNDGLCVLETNFKQSSQNVVNIINPYTKLDPTLPRIYNLKCPNESCNTNLSDKKDDKQGTEVLYIRYDDASMKYIYMCTTCNTSWK
jgi:DNA-directed RNA polymerase subunit M/transcription elongation factor TFIIS